MLTPLKYSLFCLLRCFECCGKQVKGTKKAQYWSDITAEMKSDEEKQGDVYILHPPSYQSSSLTKFIEKLDSRSKGKNKANFIPE